ncbi:hypothetical protein [Brucella pseudogrignonensis]|uniref:hypothetical protein n=1 Tax=Brucella pseudogrignonensis TaxID=419475 RepID=UPI000CFB281E|nr:hypothetical protein [Brucella pseudogrignonensis]MQP40941.1 hypothetical protein [Ochrobactrum sp. MYb237]PQZ40895.1 hypothetical protein CQ059_16725 [Brucella pseudogrignonensis]PRA40386.1 hypothetical protein CQ063_12430 [Brucella pseudogrignonensis]PRA68979.1 hypothetical protein CQ055_12315 [Brucella pseudogrignonensis]
MASSEIKVPRIRDRDIFRFLLEVANILGTDAFTVTEIGGAAGSYSTGNEEISSSYLAKSDLYTIIHASVGINQHSLTLNRNPVDAFADTLRIDTSSNAHQKPELETVRHLNELISRTFSGTAQPLEQLLTPDSAEKLISSHQEMLLKLQSTATSITETIAEAHAKLETEFADRQRQLDDDFILRSAKANEELEAERKALRDREDKLTQRSRDLDDRDNTTARRAQHATLKTRIAERAKTFEITKETKGARNPVNITVYVSALLIFSLIIYTTAVIGQLPDNASSLVWAATIIKPVGLTIALLGIIAWYLRWLNRWSERLADTEFYLKQFELDIDRANWVVETALEWKEKQDRTIPDALLGSISRNLFLKTDRDEDADMHPADYLASAILGRASALNLKVPGGELQLTGKDIRKLGKDPATDQT